MRLNELASWPPERFDPDCREDLEAWLKVIPNFRFQGGWWSKTRFGVVLDPSNGRRALWDREGRCVVTTHPNPSDPVDWAVLQPLYDYWRRRFTVGGTVRTRRLPWDYGQTLLRGGRNPETPSECG